MEVEEGRELPAPCLYRHPHTNRTLNNVERPPLPLHVPGNGQGWGPMGVGRLEACWSEQSQTTHKPGATAMRSAGASTNL